MPSCDRRYVGDIVTKLRYSPKLVESEKRKFYLTEENDLVLNLGVFADYITLCAVIQLHNKMISENEFNKIIDQIDGYVFAYEDGLLTEGQSYEHLKKDFQYVYNYMNLDWDFLIIYVDKDDFDKR